METLHSNVQVECRKTVFRKFGVRLKPRTLVISLEFYYITSFVVVRMYAIICIRGPTVLKLQQIGKIPNVLSGKMKVKDGLL